LNTGVSALVGWFRKEITIENKEKDDRKKTIDIPKVGNE
jgi:hypothetical protein